MSSPAPPATPTSSASSDGTVPAYLNLVPGGVGYPTAAIASSAASSAAAVSSSSSSSSAAIANAVQNHYHRLSHAGDPTRASSRADGLIRLALRCDTALREMALNSYSLDEEEAQKKMKEQKNEHESNTSSGDGDGSDGPPILLPSLSVLSESAFGTLTGVPPQSVKKWADAMVMSYLDNEDEEDDGAVRAVLEQCRGLAAGQGPPTPTSPSMSPSSPSTPGGGAANDEDDGIDLTTLLRALHSHYLTTSSDPDGSGQPPTVPTRPCGYVFRRGDIAWNCRTCQSDSTCVLCDACFRESDHTGHEVFFHRTSPGGCCDCGDIEAWRVEGCCPRHRPRVDVEEALRKKMRLSEPTEMGGGAGGGGGDGATAEVKLEGTGEDGRSDSDPDYEAVRSSNRSRMETAESIRSLLPPRLAAALGVVIGTAVQSIARSVEGSAIGSDPVQWEKRWTDQARRVRDECPTDEDYVLKSAEIEATDPDPDSLQWPSAPDGTADNPLPPRFRLHLRLHNDDVHTFEEVINALHVPSNSSNRRRMSLEETDTSNGLVAHRSDADEMTHHVDTDGQVTVRSYTTLVGALAGYRRLKSRGLHCSVVSTPQVESELRSRALLAWLAELCSAHPAVGGMVVHALVAVDDGGKASEIGGVRIWREARSVPSWAIGDGTSANWPSTFRPHLDTSYLSREEAERLHAIGFGTYDAAAGSTSIAPADFAAKTGADSTFYARVPQHRLPPERYSKSPHALWGTMVLPRGDGEASDTAVAPHPLLSHGSVLNASPLLERLLIVDTDFRKPQEADRLTSAMFSHELSGLSMISGVGMTETLGGEVETLEPTPEEWSQILSTASYASPPSPILLILLLDPYPPKLLRQPLHSLFLSLLIDARFKSRFAAALGGVAYRSLTTLFCAGVGTESDTPLGFTVQIFTAGSLVRALGNPAAVTNLLCHDGGEVHASSARVSQHVVTIPIAHNVVRCIHSNLLGATKEVKEAIKVAAVSGTVGADGTGEVANPSLVYQPGEHSMTALLPASPDDGFLDSRSTRHKRLPHLLRDLEYIFETPTTSSRLLLAVVAAAAQSTDAPLYSLPRVPNIKPSACLAFPTVWARLLRLGQGMDPQKRRISGGHVEYEQNRWLEAFGLSLNLAGAYDALAESPAAASGGDGCESDPENLRKSVGNLFAALLKEMKLWLYREGLLDTGVPIPPSAGALGDLGQLEALQRSTLHLSSSQIGSVGGGKAASDKAVVAPAVKNNTIALSCATSIKMTEAQLSLMEQALRIEAEPTAAGASNIVRGAVMGDWLRCPHSPLAGDCLSFHLPLHRALAKSLRCLCSVTVSKTEREASQRNWWKLPVLDDESSSDEAISLQHPLAALIRPTIRSSNCRVVWAAGPDCSSPEAQARRARSRLVSSSIAAAKIIHSLCDHPLRCLVASQQIERHLWARNGSAAAGMALNYGSAPLCRSFRDLDLTMIQFSAAGLSIGLGARRVFALLLSRFSLDGYLCDPERRGSGLSPTGSVGSGGGGSPTSYGSSSGWINPPRMQDPDHASALTECLFSTLCILITELPSPPPSSATDNTALHCNMKRELLHALAAEPRSHSEAMAAVSGAVTRRDETDSGAGSGDADSPASFRAVFADVLKEVGKQKSQCSRSTGAPTYELKAEASDEYDPTFFHLRRHEHQHAMDTVARLRRHKISPPGSPRAGGNSKCLPLVTPPPSSHPRFVPCRLLLHLPAMDASIRRTLLFALTGGKWLPPDEPNRSLSDDEADDDDEILPTRSGSELSTTAGSSPDSTPRPSPRRSYESRRRVYQRSSSSSFVKPKRGGSSLSDFGDPFSPDTVAASSVSFLEVLQILTLQVHSLEECASLHHTHALDEESRALSAGLSINSYLGRLVFTPTSLVDAWALRCAPDGPLPSKGSGANRGSVLGLLIALYEHRADHGGGFDKGGDSGNADEGHGGARALAAGGLKWLLRFVDSLIGGASSVGTAYECASSGVRYQSTSDRASMSTPDVWSIDPGVRSLVSGMLANLADLWPEDIDSASGAADAGAVSAKSREARKAAQRRAMERMMKAQSSFAASLSIDNGGGDDVDEGTADEDEGDLCIICRCDDADGENNGPLGFLGHVQRSRTLQLRSMAEVGRLSEGVSHELHRTYRVVGDRGCQLRATESLSSRPLSCLGVGSIVTVLESKVSPKYDLMSRRVRIRHTDPKTNETVEGWASIQSSQGYVILSPLSTTCYNNSRWGSTRPVIRQCGHAAHLRCVEAHCLSLHQRAAGDQPYDGRFAANIDDGEFLCPLCKQLSNILVPDIGRSSASQSLSRMNSTLSSPSPSELAEGSVHTSDSVNNRDTSSGTMVISSSPDTIWSIRDVLCSPCRIDYEETRGNGDKMSTSIKQFGEKLYQAMEIPWDKIPNIKKREQQAWHPALRRWDFEEDEGDELFSSSLQSGADDPVIGGVLRLLRQQHIAWASIGHCAASAEAASRGVTGIEDPWSGYNESTRDTDPAILDLRRAVTATSALLEILALELGKVLGSVSSKSSGMTVTLVGSLLADILEGRFWTIGAPSSPEGAAQQSIFEQWQVITGLLAAMPCHVARDGMLSQRHEARATAASLWATKGAGFPPVKEKEQEDIASDDFQPQEVHAISSAEATSASIEISPETEILPTPLAIRRICSERGINQSLDTAWGTMDPYTASQSRTPVKNDVEVHYLRSGKHTVDPSTPFRPAVAAAYLYIPLLAWDMNTLAGAVFSSMLVNKDTTSQVSNDDLLLSSRMLLIGRLVQVLVTPEGFDTTKKIDQNNWEVQEARHEFQEHWQKGVLMSEAKSLAELLNHCRSAVGRHERLGISTEEEATQFLHSVGLAILPFARSLILLLRASASILRHRERKESREKKSSSEKPSKSAGVFAALLENSNTMTYGDGFRILKAMGGPLPSQVMKDVALPAVSDAPSSWFSLINRWLSAIHGFEAYHGSRGKGLAFDTQSGAWVPSDTCTLPRNATEDGMQSDQKDDKKFIVQEQSIQTASSSEGTMGVEVEVAPAGGQQDQQDGQGELPYNGSIDMDDASDGYGGMEDVEEGDGGLVVDVHAELLDIDMEDEDSYEDEMEDVEMAVQMDFAGGNQGSAGHGYGEPSGDASDDDNSCISSSGRAGNSGLDKDFAHVSCSAIVPFQPSILGVQGVGPGPRGCSFEYSIASPVMSDLSHLGMVHRIGSTGSGLIRLPHSFIELYSLVNKVKGRADTSNGAMDDTDDGSSSETAICLLTGAIMASGSSRRHYSRASRPAGACTLHARQIGSGIGIFFLVQKCTVLLVHNNKSAYSSSLYVDENGEEDPGLRRGRPLFLKDDRYEALEKLWREHAIPREVAQTRSTSDRVIRDNWY